MSGEIWTAGEQVRHVWGRKGVIVTFVERNAVVRLRFGKVRIWPLAELRKVGNA